MQDGLVKGLAACQGQEVNTYPRLLSAEEKSSEERLQGGFLVPVSPAGR